ncbi:hypothetical protein PBRA_003333 [Plasmodiophora brassicae]|uniref:Uncharacterized protein n=1 Tax=Plasmodiophora brassicae TaxID=37360 RepID=A0A0G4J8X1_PLABS|nr:hypothetical protein PBRA_003333 [Plasmodiophora brassicae]
MDLSDLIESDEDVCEAPSAIADDGASDDSEIVEDDVGSDVELDSVPDDDGEQSDDAEEDDDDEDGDDGTGNTDDIDGILSNGDGDSDDNEDAHRAVMSMVEAMSRRDEARTRRKADVVLERMSSVAEGDQFDVHDGSAKLSIDALVDPLRSSASFASMKASLDKLATDRHEKVADVPLEPAHRQRLERNVAFTSTSKELDKWTHLVKANREAARVSFPLKDHKIVESTASLTAKFTPTTSLETDLDALLKMYKLDERSVCKNDDPLLSTNDSASPEEIEKRHAEIARMRALMFYHELRAKRIKKIKSKKFRKMLKKQRAKHEGDDEDGEDDEVREKRELERINARMSLRVKNTSKWMKSALKHGGVVDPEVRARVADQQRNMEALRDRIRSVKGAGSSDDDNDDDAEIEALAQEIKDDVPVEGKRGVFGLKFMVKAAAKQKAEAEAMLKELQRAAEEDDDDNDSDKEAPAEGKPAVSGRRTFGGLAPASSTEPAAPTDKRFEATGTSLQSVAVASGAAFRSRTAGPVSSVSKQQDDDNPWLNVNSSAIAARERKAANDDVVLDTEVVSADDDDDDNDDKFVLLDDGASAERRELVRRAFPTAGDEGREFAAEKAAVAESELPDLEQEHPATMPGWGSWAGDGVTASRASRKRAAKRAHELQRKKQTLLDRRRDGSMSHVIINEKVDRKSAKYKVGSVPFPFTSREQYERSLQVPIGREWNSAGGHADLIAPAVTCRVGAVIAPITYSKGPGRRR